MKPHLEFDRSLFDFSTMVTPAHNKRTHGGTNLVITSAYDSLNRLQTMTEGGRTTRCGYDLIGGVAKLTQQNTDTTEKSFDALGRATSITTKTAGTAFLSSYTHGFDLAGNCRKIVEDYATGGLVDRTVTNSYDAIGRLKTETATAATTVVTGYDYDVAHNRTAKLVTGQSPARTVYTNNLNQADYHYIDANNNSIWDIGETKTTYLHDFNGNRSSAAKSTGNPATLTTDTYGYDYENRLINIVKATPGTDLQTGTFGYIYDYRTRRVERNESAASGALTKLIFSGGTSVQEYDSSSALPTVQFIRGSDYGGGIGGVLYSLRGGNPAFTHYNSRGDVVAKTNSSGALTFQASYEAYGKRTASQGSNLDRQNANTKEEDPTGLLNEGFRYRDLESGTFITRDPLGFVDGPNVYTYVRQNPWTFYDPLGLKIDDQSERVTEKEVIEPGSMPDRGNYVKYGMGGKERKEGMASYKKAKESWESARDTATANSTWNRNNARNIQAWKNYDIAIELLEKTTQGLELLTTLRNSDSVYTIVLDGEYRLGNEVARVGGDILGSRKYMGEVNGIHHYASMVTPAVMTQSDAMSNGKVNVDSAAYGVMWEELYHNDQSEARSKIYGTYSPKDSTTNPQHLSHERRATRFQNIIRNRLGGKRVDRIYGRGTGRETQVPDPLGTNITK